VSCDKDGDGRRWRESGAVRRERESESGGVRCVKVKEKELNFKAKKNLVYRNRRQNGKSKG
jgi:hypothetical protein